MTTPDRKRLSESRMRLGNPYAFIEQLEEFNESQELGAPHQLGSVSSASRKLLENPYAYMDGDGFIPGRPRRPKRVGKRVSWTDDQILQKAQELQRRIWRERKAIWGTSIPTDPVDFLDPGIALEMSGYDFDLVDGLGRAHGGDGSIEVAGFIDSKARVVRVGRQFPLEVRAFTAAHELGHALLHPNMGALHRDRPLDGSPSTFDRVEIEANKFATYFLMPERLVRARFVELFRTNRIELTEEMAYALASCSLSELVSKHGSQRQMARLLAGAERFDGRHFIALNRQFRVSREAMAIRLEELGLVPGGV